MSHPTILAYLDAGTGAAIAAVVASGAVGVRTVLGSARNKLRRGGADRVATSPEATTPPREG